jgi:hypothetical protein
LSWIVLIDVVAAENVSVVVLDVSKIAVLAGTVAGAQLPAAFQLFVPGAASQVASWACAALPRPPGRPPERKSAGFALTRALLREG